MTSEESRQEFTNKFVKRMDEIPLFEGINPTLLKNIAGHYYDFQKAIESADQMHAHSAVSQLSVCTSELVRHVDRAALTNYSEEYKDQAIIGRAFEVALEEFYKPNRQMVVNQSSGKKEKGLE